MQSVIVHLPSLRLRGEIRCAVDSVSFVVRSSAFRLHWAGAG